MPQLPIRDPAEVEKMIETIIGQLEGLRFTGKTRQAASFEGGINALIWVLNTGAEKWNQRTKQAIANVIAQRVEDKKASFLMVDDSLADPQSATPDPVDPRPPKGQPARV